VYTDREVVTESSLCCRGASLGIAVSYTASGGRDAVNGQRGRKQATLARTGTGGRGGSAIQKPPRGAEYQSFGKSADGGRTDGRTDF
jgi:hypothetical protein